MLWRATAASLQFVWYDMVWAYSANCLMTIILLYLFNHKSLLNTKTVSIVFIIIINKSILELVALLVFYRPYHSCHFLTIS